MSKRKPMLATLLAGLLMLPIGLQPVQANPTEQSVVSPVSLQDAFAAAADEFGVPLPVLMATSYAETRWEMHPGEQSFAGGYGVMHLTQVDNPLEHGGKGEEDEAAFTPSDDPALHTLDAAAALLGVEADLLKTDLVQNIRGGAALLAKHARDLTGELPKHTADWYGAVAKYNGSAYADLAKEYADRVFATINKGAARTTEVGLSAVLPAEAVAPNTATAEPLFLRNADKADTDCPNGVDCRFLPAAYKQYSGSATDYGNYDIANRPADGNEIKYIIIHDIEGSALAGIRTFQTKSYVSAHYVIDSETGQITQMVRPKDVAWHAGNWYVNAHSIGIEHSGFAADYGKWYTEKMYQASAKLVKYLAERYNIPLDRQHILGHDDLPGLTPYSQSRMHWDPGTYFDWAHYFDLLGAPINPSDATAGSGIVSIDVDFKHNEPTSTYGNKPQEPAPSSFLYLHTAPSAEAPLLSDPALHPKGEPGSRNVNDWGNKAVIGHRYAVADQAGDWTAIWYAGQKAWFHNPQGKHTVPSSGLKITPKAGKTAIPVYGSAFPNAAEYAAVGIPARLNTALQYSILPGQWYVATDAFKPDYFYAKLYDQPSTYRVVEGADDYYQITFNHRQAFVKKSDVDVVDTRK